MKCVRTLLFQITVLVVSLMIMAHPLRADTDDTIQTDTPYAQAAPVTKSGPAHHSVSAILVGIESGFMAGVVPLVAAIMFGLAIWRVVPSRRPEPMVIEQAPVEVPPLRQIPYPITKF